MSLAVPSIGSCLACGYDLRGLENHQCPECGRAFNPADATTMGPPGLRLGLVARWALAPVGWAAWVFTGGTLLAILWHARFPQSVREQVSTYRAFWSVLIAFWSARLMVQLLSRVRLRHIALRRRINVRRTTLVLAAGLCIAIAVHDDMVCHASLRISRPAFQRLASSRAAGGDITFSRPRWVGLYRIEGAYKGGVEGQTYFYSVEADAAFSLIADSLTIDDDYMSSTVVPFIY